MNWGLGLTAVVTGASEKPILFLGLRLRQSLRLKTHPANRAILLSRLVRVKMQHLLSPIPEETGSPRQADLGDTAPNSTH
jgi:hypothetical protein